MSNSISHQPHILPIKGFDIIPQPGRQQQFLECPADGIIYGGAAFGAKTFSLLMEACRNCEDSAFSGIIFRRKSTEITLPGALWDTAEVVFGANNVNAQMRRNDLTALFPKGGKVKFSHLEYESNVYDHHGGQYSLIGFDELTTFTRRQFFYLLTRNRSPYGCKVRPYWRATCNADADSWVREIIDWWIDPDTGYPIPERAGVLRYYTIVADQVVWVGPEWRDEDGQGPKSITFISSKITDNVAGMAANPEYRATLRAQDTVTRERLEAGNWNISFKGGMFDPDWFEKIDLQEVPKDIKMIRYWDMAATKPDKKTESVAYTAGAKVGLGKDGYLYVIDVIRFQESPGEAEKKMREIAYQDGPEVAIGWEEEKGSSGKYVSSHLAKDVFKGYECHPDAVSGQKEERAKPLAAYAHQRMVRIVKGLWNQSYLAELGAFPKGERKDQVDATTGCVKHLMGTKRVLFAYVPTEYRHRKAFRKDIEEFGRYTPDQLAVYCAIWYDRGGGLYGLCCAWARTTQKLRVYGEFSFPSPIVEKVAAELQRIAVVSMNGRPNEVKIEKILCNQDMHEGGTDVVKQLKKYGIRPKVPKRFDEAGAIMFANMLFSEEAVTIHTDAVDLDSEVRTWTVEDDLPKKGFPLAKALLLIVSELRDSHEIVEEEELPEYSREKQKIREKLKANEHGDPRKIVSKTQEYDYLLK